MLYKVAEMKIDGALKRIKRSEKAVKKAKGNLGDAIASVVMMSTEFKTQVQKLDDLVESAQQ